MLIRAVLSVLLYLSAAFARQTLLPGIIDHFETNFIQDMRGDLPHQILSFTCVADFEFH